MQSKTKPLMEREERIAAVNALIVTIGSYDRKFLSSHSDNWRTDRPLVYSRFELRSGRLWYIDKYKEVPIYMHNRPTHNWRFSDGGTLWWLICEFRDFILDGGKKDRSSIFLAANDNYWGYRKESAEIIFAKAREVGFLN